MSRRFDDHPKHIREARKLSMCEGKEAHTRVSANRIVRETLKVKLDAYRCPFCENWHVGHKKKE